MEEVALLVCSDLHGAERSLQILKKMLTLHDFDALVVCGDFTTYGSRSFMAKILSSVDTRVLAVPGNCDTDEMLDMLESANASIHGKNVEFMGWRFYGFGGAVPSPHKMPFEVEEDEMARVLRKVATPSGIMVTHTPPLGMNDLSRIGHHMGSRRLLEVAQEFRPVLCLSGHVHESRGKMHADGTTYVNPGSLREGMCASIRLGQSIQVELLEG